jgi:anthranilate synthase component II
LRLTAAALNLPELYTVALILGPFMILLIDNYDSFTHNLAHLIGGRLVGDHLVGGMREDIEVVRNDAISADDALKSGATAIIISPGPGEPKDAGICLDLIKGAAKTRMPVFGVCLGMQAIAQSFGGKIRRAGKLMHGKTCAVRHTGAGIFEGVPSPFTATRYHSLVADAASLPEVLTVTANANDDDEIMAVEHKTLPISGVQFHPESIATEHGAQLLGNFLERVKG